MATEQKEIYHELIDIKQIHQNDYNPNQMTEFERKALKQSMGSGNKQTILLRPCACSQMKAPHWVIVDGEQRWNEARDSGIGKLHALIVEEDEQQAMIDTLALNKIRGSPDPMKLIAMVNTLQTKYAMSQDEISLRTGFTTPELKIAMNKAKQTPAKKGEVPKKLQNIIIVCNDEEKNFIEECMNTFQAKSKKEFQRNGTLLVEMLK